MIDGKNQWLKLGGVLSFFVAILYLSIIFVGAPAYRYFGAPKMYAVAAENGLIFPAIVTLFLTMIFTVWGLYAFSGAGIIRRLPLLKPFLLVTGSIYTIRGIFFFLQIFQTLAGFSPTEPRKIVFSFISLLIGILYLIGTIKSRKLLT